MKNYEQILTEINNVLLDPNVTNEQRQILSTRILDIALSIRGYNNFQSDEVSGEKFFINEVLSKLNPKVCVDVGANVGGYSAALLESTNSQVYAFEPLFEPFNELSRLKKHYGERFISENKGVGRRNEVLDLYFNESATEHASFSTEIQNVPYVKNQNSRKIEVVSLDSYFKDKSQIIDFIKIDTEGYEYEVIVGAQRILRENRPKAIQIEFNWHQLFRGQSLWSLAQLFSGYKAYQLLPNLLMQRDPRDPYSNVYCFSNFVFIRSDLI